MLRCILHRILHCISYYIVWYVALYTTLYDTIHAILHAILHCRIHYRTTAYRGISSRWMCVKHLNRCKTSTCWRSRFFVFSAVIFTAGGGCMVRHCLSMVIWRRDAFWVSAISFPVRFSQSVKVGTIWLSWKGRVSFQLISSSIDYGDGSFLLLCGSFHRPIPVRCNWNVFAHKVHSTSKFAMTILSEQVCVGLARDILNKKDLLFADV